MTYLGFLGVALGLPLLALGGLLWRDWRCGRQLPSRLRGWPPLIAGLAHMAVALIYATPWDNYLVATGVWWYDPRLVLGVKFGWVPLEEYLFIMLQPLLSVVWLVVLAGRLPAATSHAGHSLRRVAPLALGGLWLGAVAVLLAGWQPGVYLALVLAWALPPLMLQLVVGADILWQHRRLAVAAVLSTSAYLAVADAAAISAGIWTISPAQSLNVLVGRVLPVEEIVFFFATNLLIVFGVVLALAVETRPRLAAQMGHWRRLAAPSAAGDNGPRSP